MEFCHLSICSCRVPEDKKAKGRGQESVFLPGVSIARRSALHTVKFSYRARVFGYVRDAPSLCLARSKHLRSRDFAYTSSSVCETGSEGLFGKCTHPALDCTSRGRRYQAPSILRPLVNQIKHVTSLDIQLAARVREEGDIRACCVVVKRLKEMARPLLVICQGQVQCRAPLLRREIQIGLTGV
jgi:hypothetical protein